MTGPAVEPKRAEDVAGLESDSGKRQKMTQLDRLKTMTSVRFLNNSFNLMTILSDQI